ncbi:hypothetical protein O0L34_g3700 [Tuta absoluta]|nr:hypothetical protein O0L34_g3700 [Tuta absoluta]
MNKKTSPKYLQDIQNEIASKVKLVKVVSSELFETKQSYFDEILEIYRVAVNKLISHSITYSGILNEIKSAYENALRIRDERIKQFIIHDVSIHIQVPTDSILLG